MPPLFDPCPSGSKLEGVYCVGSIKSEKQVLCGSKSYYLNEDHICTKGVTYKPRKGPSCPQGFEPKRTGPQLERRWICVREEWEPPFTTVFKKSSETSSLWLSNSTAETTNNENVEAISSTKTASPSSSSSSSSFSSPFSSPSAAELNRKEDPSETTSTDETLQVSSIMTSLSRQLKKRKIATNTHAERSNQTEETVDIQESHIKTVSPNQYYADLYMPPQLMPLFLECPEGFIMKHLPNVEKVKCWRRIIAEPKFDEICSKGYYYMPQLSDRCLLLSLEPTEQRCPRPTLKRGGESAFLSWDPTPYFTPTHTFRTRKRLRRALHSVQSSQSNSFSTAASNIDSDLSCVVSRALATNPRCPPGFALIGRLAKVRCVRRKLYPVHYDCRNLEGFQFKWDNKTRRGICEFEFQQSDFAPGATHLSRRQRFDGLVISHGVTPWNMLESAGNTTLHRTRGTKAPM